MTKRKPLRKRSRKEQKAAFAKMKKGGRSKRAYQSYLGYKKLKKELNKKIKENKELNRLAKEQGRDFKFRLTGENINRLMSDTIRVKAKGANFREAVLSARRDVKNRLRRQGYSWEED